MASTQWHLRLKCHPIAMASPVRMSSHCNGILDYNVITLQWHPRLQCHPLQWRSPSLTVPLITLLSLVYEI